MSNETQVAAHMALVNNYAMTLKYIGVSQEEIHSARAAVEASARQLAQQAAHKRLAIN